MICKKCGKEIDNDSRYCTACGYYDDSIEDILNDEEYDYVEEVDEEDFAYKDQSDDEEYTEEYEEADFKEEKENKKTEDNFSKKEKKKKSFFQYDEEEIESYGFKNDRFIEFFIGEDYKWIIKRKINIYALLLSWIYFLYRKMYIIGTIGLIITGIVVRLFPKFLIVYVPVVMILCGLLFNPIYKFFTNARIDSIKRRNPDADDYELEQLCQKYGGVNVINPLIIFLIFMLIMIRTYYSFHINNENKKFWNENSENKANCQSIAVTYYNALKEEKIDGNLVDTVCSIEIKNNKKDYNIYMKTEKEKKYRYISFKKTNDSIEVEGIKGDLDELQEKHLKNTLTEEEEQTYTKLNNIKNKYNEIYNKSLNEDELIKTRKNKSEKLNYIFKKDDIIR